MKRTALFFSALLCFSISIRAMEEEIVDEIIFKIANTDGRTIPVKYLINDYLNTKNNLDTQRIEQLKRILSEMPVAKYNQFVSDNINTTRSKKKKKGSTDLVQALFAITDQLEKQNENMAESGELAKKVHAWNVRNYRWATLVTIFTMVVTNGIQLFFNVSQGVENSNLSAMCNSS